MSHDRSILSACFSLCLKLAENTGLCELVDQYIIGISPWMKRSILGT